MAYVPDIKQPGYAPAWQTKKADKQNEFETSDGNKYILYVPSSNQFDAYEKSLKKYKDIFNQIKTDVKDNLAIAKSRDNLPKDFDHFSWAEIFSLTFKKLNKTWGVNDKIWIRNKNDDGTKYNPVVLAITPVTTQRNAKRGTRKVSASAAGSEFDIDPNDIEFGPSLPSITQSLYVRTKNGLKYFYRTEADADKDNHFMIKNEMDEVVDEDGNKLDPDGDFKRFVQEGKKDKQLAPPRAKSAYPSDDESEDGYEYNYESDSEINNYDYNDGIPPYEGAMWDDEFQVWVSNPMDPEIYDEEGNYKIPPEDIIVEPEPAPMPAPAPAPAFVPIQDPEKEKRDKLRAKRRRMMEKAFAEEKALAKQKTLASMPVPMPIPVPMPPPAPMPAPASTEDPLIVEARIGLPPGWQPLISRGTGKVYYYNPEKGNQYERPTMGGKRTRRRPRPKSRAKQPKNKRTTKRRKRTTRRRK